jgi:acyl carrier protein
LLTSGNAAKPFDAGADGYVRGEGCGMVVLKPLTAALEARDRIYAVVRGVATGHMGRGNGLGAPSSAALGHVIAAAHGAARTSPGGMGYVEVQGTGTRVGDAIEVQALKTQCAGAPEDAVCVMGTAKVNIGHLEAASGVAGLMKVALCLHHGVIPPHRNLEQLSPDINLDGTPLVIRRELSPWPRGRAPRIAGVTAFGFGGASVHAVLAEAPEAHSAPGAVEAWRGGDGACHLLALSAKTPEALQRLARSYAEMLEAPGTLALEEICFSANTGRVHFAFRRVFYAREPGAMAAQLRVFSEAGTASPACPEMPAAAHAVATAYLAGSPVDWHACYAGHAVRKIGLPGYPFSEERCWLDETAPVSGGNGRRGHGQGAAPETGEAAGHLRLALGATAPAQRVARMQAYLLGLIAEALGVPLESLDPERNLLELGLDSLTATEVLGRVSLDLDLVVYPREAFDHPTPARLAAHLVRALQVPITPHGNGHGRGAAAPGIDFFRLRLRQHRADDAHGQPNPAAVFLLSAPRSGSTLLRVMLAGHPDLFVPPELHLLLFDTMAQRRDELAGTGLDAGFVRALMELQGIGEAESRRQATLFERGALPVKQAFHLLQQAAAPRLLVDKSPTYAGSLETLQRAERLFDQPKYVYLMRHPYAVIESLVRTRLEQLAAGAPDQPFQNAEAMWTLANHNIRTFLKQVPEERRHVLDYEALVREPETTLRALCGFLELPYHPAVLTPYEGARMADEAVSGVTGDPHFLRRGAIDPGLAEVWRDITLPGPLGSCTRRLARELGYTLPREPGDDDRLASPRTVFEEGGI